MATLTRGELAEIQAGIRPSAVFNTITFDGGVESGALAAKATLSTALTGDNNDIVYTAEANGVSYNDVSVEYRDPNAGGQSIIVSMDSAKAIVVNLGTSAGVKATATLTSTDVFTGDETVTIDDVTYTFVASLTTDPETVPYEVLIGASAAASLDNLKSAVNGTAGEGTTYGTGTVAHPTVTATTNANDSQVFEAIALGTAGNSIATTSTAANNTFGAATMVGGEDIGQIVSTGDDVKTAIEANASAAALVDVADKAANDGSGVVTVMAKTYLSGGSDGKIPLFRVTGGIICSLRGYIETSLTGTNATLVHGVTGTTNMLIPILTSTTLTAKKGIDKSAAVVNRGTALDKIPLWYVQDEDIFATTATAATATGKIHYVLDLIALTEDATVEAL